MRLALALLLTLPAGLAAADETTGEILAYDRLAHILVMRDRTVWTLPDDLMVPADLKSGDRIRVVYKTAGEDGLTAVDAIERIEE